MKQNNKNKGRDILSRPFKLHKLLLQSAAKRFLSRSLLMADFNITKFMVEVAEDVVVSVTDEHTL